MRWSIKHACWYDKGGILAESAGFSSFRGLACHDERLRMSYCLSVGLKGGNGKEKLSTTLQSLYYYCAHVCLSSKYLLYLTFHIFPYNKGNSKYRRKT